MTEFARLFAVEKLFCLGLVAGLFMFGGAVSAGAQNSPLLNLQAGSFNVETSEAEEGLQTLQVTYKGQDISEDREGIYREITASEPALDFPESGLETLKINIYTGGANCCQGYYLLVHGENGQSYAAYLPPYDGGLSPNDDPAGYAAIDPAFKGYTKEGIFLSRAESPRLSRLLVFADGMWRVDKIGEFPEYYKSMFGETEAASEMHPVSKAIALSYYNLMQGNAPVAARAELKGRMPAEFASEHLVDQVFEDIRRAAEEFNPVKNINLN